MPNGLIYEGVSDVPFQYSGGSAAQCSLIHAWDTALGVRHWKTKATSVSMYLHSNGSGDADVNLGRTDADGVGGQEEAAAAGRGIPIPSRKGNGSSSSSSGGGGVGSGIGSAGGAASISPVAGGGRLSSSPYAAVAGSPPVPPPAGHNESFLHEMRFYMPAPHREFLLALADGPSIREFVRAHASSCDRLLRAYNGCLDKITAFRSTHVNIVATYIIAQAAKERRKSSLAARGTGGTDLLPFLKQARDETLQTMVPAGDAAAQSGASSSLAPARS